MSGLGLTFLRRAGQAHPTAGSSYIKFADDKVLAVLISRGVSSDGVGITRDDARNLQSIGNWFQGNNEITSFEEFQYFDNITSLSDRAFNGCSALTTIAFPSSLRTIGSLCFYQSGIVGHIDLEEVYQLNNGAFNSGKLSSLNAPQLSIIGESSFNGCSQLTRVNIPNATQIGAYAFYNCTSLTEAEFGAQVTAIGIKAFLSSLLGGELHLPLLQTIESGAFGSTKVTLLDAPNLQIIKDSVFNGCSLLQTAYIPSVTQIEAYAFYRCTNLTAVVIDQETPPSVTENSFGGISNLRIYVPDSVVDTYKAATGWSTYANMIYPRSQYNG